MMKKLLIILFVACVSCESSCPETEMLDISCFENFTTIIKDKVTSDVDFSKIINCFEWDRLEVHSESNHKAYKCFRFHQIDADGGVYLGKELEDNMDWFDGDRHWYFIHFYKGEQLLPEILAISESIVSFDNLTQERKLTPSFSKEQTNFYMTKIIYGGIEGKEMLKQRQIIKLQPKKEAIPSL